MTESLRVRNAPTCNAIDLRSWTPNAYYVKRCVRKLGHVGRHFYELFRRASQ